MTRTSTMAPTTRVSNMRVHSVSEARKFIKRNHMKVKVVERVKGGLRYQVVPKGKKHTRHPMTIVVNREDISNTNNQKEA